jgi:hypothetical protein
MPTMSCIWRAWWLNLLAYWSGLGSEMCGSRMRDHLTGVTDSSFRTAACGGLARVGELTRLVDGAWAGCGPVCTKSKPRALSFAG